MDALKYWTMLLGVAGILFGARAFAEANPVDAYDVVWNTPSQDSSGSMPLGNGDLGINAWVEDNGDLLFYISKTDAWDENARLVKLGRVRVHFTPISVKPFIQTLRLHDGLIETVSGDPVPITTRIWVDANAPGVRIETSAETPFEIAVGLEIWRTAERTLTGAELFSAYGLDKAPHPVVVAPDTLMSGGKDRVLWYHRNDRSIWPETLTLQGMEAWTKQATDPLLHRTFGGMVRGDGLIKAGPALLKSNAPGTHHTVSVVALTAQTPTIEEWLAQLEQLGARLKAISEEDAYKAHKEWWHAFWNRSWIRVSGAPDAEVVSRGYALQRFISACAGRGAFPIKFNGSIFTVDSREEGKHFDADYRSWGGPYWFQNTRLAYWPMPASGDCGMMLPLFKMYRDALPFAQARTRVYFNHDGAFFPETMYFWGAYANDNYGWNREGKPASFVENTYIRWYWSGALELLSLMLDYFEYTEDRAFVSATLLPAADAVLEFYDKHYPRDASRKLHFEPAAGLETWQQVINPLPEIAGLQFVTEGLLALPEALTTDAQRATWKRLRAELPPLPTQVVDGHPSLAPAERILEEARNSENPELYAIFPYRLYGVAKPDLNLARRTFEQRKVKGNNGWRQDDTQAAFLGLAARAREYLAGRFAAHHPGSRFPAFWGPNFDWIPDQDHGCNGLITLQTMLLQTDGRKILLFPAWPKEWDVTFKLHAPLHTTIEGVCLAGKIEQLTVTPPERNNDILVLPCQ